MRSTSSPKTFGFLSGRVRQRMLLIKKQVPGKWRRRFLLIMAVLAVVATACSSAGGTSSEGVLGEIDVVENVSYNNGGGLDIYIPQRGEGWPVVLLFHGNPPPSRGPLAPLAETLASRGVLVMNVGWRSDVVAWDSIEGIGCAVRFARSRAAEYGGDSSRITVVGYSAGATASVAIALAGDQFQGDCTETDGSPFPDFFVGIAGFYDPQVTPTDARSEIKESEPDLYELLNPMNHLGRNPELQVALVHGSEDGHSPVETSTQFHRALTESGYQASLTILDGLGHGNILDSASLVEAILDVATSEHIAGERSSTDGNGLGDPGTWLWHVLDEPPDEIISDGNLFYRFTGWPEPFGAWSSGDGLTWQPVTDSPTKVFPPAAEIVASQGHVLLVLESPLFMPRSLPGHLDGVDPNSSTVLLVEPDGVVDGRFLPGAPETLGDFVFYEVTAAGVGPKGAVIWTTLELDADVIAAAAFGDEWTEALSTMDSCIGCDVHPEIADGTIRLERILANGSVEQVAGPVSLADLGIDEKGLQSGSLLWLSADGRSWRSVPAPDVLPVERRLDSRDIGEAEIVGIDDGFVLAHQGGVMFSADGEQWRNLLSPGRLEFHGLAPWRGQALLWNDDAFWRVTSEGVERLGLSASPGLIEDGSHLVGAGEAGIAYLHLGQSGQLEIVYSPDGHRWSQTPLPPRISELIDVESVWWSGPPIVGQEAVLLESTPTPDGPHSLLQATAGDR